jgi:hypothetical protein
MSESDEIPLSVRMQLFKESPGYKWPKLTDEDIIQQKRGRKPQASKRIVKTPHYQWWKDGLAK